MRPQLLFLLLISGSFAFGQSLTRGEWFIEDFSVYDDYFFGEIKLNEERAVQGLNVDEFPFFDQFKTQMKKKGFQYNDSSVLAIHFHFQLDTLKTGFERPDGPLPKDVYYEIDITLVDIEVDERVFKGFASNMGQGPKKLNKLVRDMVNAFFDPNRY